MYKLVSKHSYRRRYYYEIETAFFWFVTGSQHLYGPETLEQVAEHSRIVATEFDKDPVFSYPIVFKPIVTTPDEIYNLILEANNDESCAGIMTWMHTFSPAKMWIAGYPNCRSRFFISIPNSIGISLGKRLIWTL